MKIVLLLLLGSRRTTRGIYKPTRWDPRRGRENWPKVGFIFFPFLSLSAAGIELLGSVDVHCVLVICHILKRGGGDSLSRDNFSAKNVSRSGCSVSFPCMLCSWLRWFLVSESFMCDEKHRWCFSCLHSYKGSDKHRRPSLSSILVICSFRLSRRLVEVDSFPESYQESCRNG